MTRHSTAVFLALSLLGAVNASAHLTYSAARSFGLINGVSPQSVTISGQTTKIFGWADGTDADWAKQDDQRYLHFTLQNTAEVTITITSLNAALIPAFSLFSGVGHSYAGGTFTGTADFDGADNTLTYLNSLGAPTREGAFDALHTWKIGNGVATGQDLAVLTYIGNASDGNSSNYGPASGINGDGVVDGTVTKTFTLPAGEYTMAIGGANYFNQTDAAAYGFNATVSVPEPSCALLLAGGLCAAGAIRRRRSQASA